MHLCPSLVGIPLFSFGGKLKCIINFLLPEVHTDSKMLHLMPKT